MSMGSAIAIAAVAAASVMMAFIAVTYHAPWAALTSLLMAVVVAWRLPEALCPKPKD